MRQSMGKVPLLPLGQHSSLVGTKDAIAKGHSCKLNPIFGLGIRQSSEKTGNP